MKGFMSAEDDSELKNETSGTRLWVILWRATRAVEQNAMSSVSALGLGLSDFAVLELLLHRGAQPVNVIGQRVLLSSGSITTAIHRLESRKLVYRTTHPEDRRARLVHLTSQGKRLISHLFEQHARDMEETVAVLEPGERIELGRLLKKVGLVAASRLAAEEGPSKAAGDTHRSS
jgi:MarR family 2-MHQ and catechol resistance regulon transcriptional repressor